MCCAHLIIIVLILLLLFVVFLLGCLPFSLLIYEFFIYSKYESLVCLCIAGIFSHSVTCLFALLMMPSEEQKFLILVQFINMFIVIAVVAC